MLQKNGENRLFMSLKILMICPEFFPKLGGTEIQALNLSKALKSKGVEVSILTRLNERTWKIHETIEGLNVTRIDYPRIRWIGGLLLNVGLSWNILKRNKEVDVLHFHIGGSHMLLPVLISLMLGKPSLLKISGWWELEKGFLRPSGFIPSMMRRIIFRCNGIIALSKEICDRLISLGYPAQRIVALSNGVDISRFRPAQREGQKPVIIFVGRLVTEKGVLNLLTAIDRLRKQFPDIKLNLVGIGSDEENLKQMSFNLGLDDCVRFCGRIEDVTDSLRNSDIYVQPSLNEGLPNSLLEAMATGLPVVVTRIGGMPDVVVNEVEGFVVSPGNVDELVLAIGKLLDDENLRRKMGAEGRARILREFSFEYVTDKYINYYKALLTK